LHVVDQAEVDHVDRDLRVLDDLESLQDLIAHLLVVRPRAGGGRFGRSQALGVVGIAHALTLAEAPRAASPACYLRVPSAALTNRRSGRGGRRRPRSAPR